MFPDFEGFLPMFKDRADNRWGKALTFAKLGNLDAAAQLITTILREGQTTPPSNLQSVTMSELDSITDHLAVNAISNAYAMRNKPMPKAAIELFCAAADVGYPDMAYNAANALAFPSKSIESNLRAQKYFLIAIDAATTPSAKAAALVNYAPIIRDGQISGQPDWPGAIGIYEQAAELGLLTGMFNTANVSMWVFEKGDDRFIEKGIFWLGKILEHYREDKDFLDMDQPETRDQLLENAKNLLARMHIQAECSGTDPAYGLQLLRSTKPEHGESPLLRPWLTERAMTRIVMNMAPPALRTPGNHWHSLLKTIGWDVHDEVISRPDMDAELFMVVTTEGPMPFVVMSSLFSPGERYELLDAIQGFMLEAGLEKFFIAPSHAVFKAFKGRVHTPIMVSVGDQFKIGTLGLTSTPKNVIANAKVEFEATDLRFTSDSCVISIAINRMNEGDDPRQGLDLGSMWAGFGPWCLPIKTKESGSKIKTL